MENFIQYPLTQTFLSIKEGGEMKLEKAIEILEGALADKWCPWSQELKDSIKLSIEAMKRELKDRQGTFTILLPGETKE
jgi:hypothetical protein